MNKKNTDADLEALVTNAAKNNISFLLKLSHELKTPIHGISGISEYLSENWENLDNKTRKSSVVAILKASNSLAELLDSLLKKAHNNEKIGFDFRLIDLVKEAKSVVNLCQDLNINRKNIDIRVDSELAECYSMADPFWYRQLLTNLISNAINYSTKGTIYVIFKTQIINGINNYVVAVKDEGIGIPEEELQTIFAPFNRGSSGDKYMKGTGIGLSICSEIVAAHFGSIYASNNKNVGSTIKFVVPIKMEN